MNFGRSVFWLNVFLCDYPLQNNQKGGKKSMFRKMNQMAIILIIAAILLFSTFNLPVSAQEPPYLQPIALGNTACGICAWPTVCNLDPPRVLQSAPTTVPRGNVFAWTSLWEISGSTSEFEALICSGMPYQEICNGSGIWGVPGTSNATLEAYESVMFDPTFDVANKEKDLSGNVTGWWVLIPQDDRVDPMTPPDPNLVMGYAFARIIAVCAPGTCGCKGYYAPPGLCAVYPLESIVIDRITCFACEGSSDISVFPDSLDFGEILAQTSSPFLTLIVSNYGNNVLPIFPLQITGTDCSNFSILYDYCSGKILMPLENCPVGLVFSPASGGSKNANLSITSNDPFTPVLDVPLSGTGIPLGDAPMAPTNLTATSISESVIKLTWTDNSTDETSFKVYRKIGAGSWSLLATKGSDEVSHTNWTATGNTTTTTYSYYVKACNSCGCSPKTSTAVVPYRPTNLAATASSAGQIDLQWADNSSNETGFQIERKSGSCLSTNSWGKVKTVVQNITSYSDTGVASGKTYSYRVRAYKKSWATPYAYGYSKYSTCPSAKTP
jgi:hypothetical protein